MVYELMFLIVSDVGENDVNINCGLIYGDVEYCEVGCFEIGGKINVCE